MKLLEKPITVKTSRTLTNQKNVFFVNAITAGKVLSNFVSLWKGFKRLSIFAKVLNLVRHISAQILYISEEAAR